MVSQVSTFLQEVQSSDLQQQEVEVAMSFNSDGSIIKANVVLIGPLNGSAAPPPGYPELAGRFRCSWANVGNVPSEFKAVPELT